MSISHKGTTMQIYSEFELLCRRAFLRRLWCGMTGQRYQLLNLEGVQTQGVGQGRRHGGIQFVAIAQICGSEGRSQDFDANFCPLNDHNRERWVNIALARREDVVLPLVELIQIGDRYFVRDGHHRISVAKAQGQLEIEAEVTCWDVTTPNTATDRVAAQAPRCSTLGLRAVGQVFGSLVTSLVARFVPEAKLSA